MKDELTLVIMAAGMGSRFGGLKQIEPMGPNGEFLIDYAIYDAIKAGFTKVVFVIKEENFDIFKKTIGRRLEDKIEVCYAFQKMDDLPLGYEVPRERIKPLGTAQAIYAARNYVNGSFAVINSDDFYGREAYQVMSEFLKKDFNDQQEHYCNVCYEVKNTITSNGSVKRGVVSVKDGYLTSLLESKIEMVDGKIVASPLDGSEKFTLAPDTLVSMNMLGFSHSIFDYIEREFPKFLDSHQTDILNAEFLIPDVLAKAIDTGFALVHVIKTTAVWHGVTYKEDKEDVQAALKELVEEGVYPESLWK